MCKTLQKKFFPSKQNARMCFSTKFKGKFPLLDLHLSNRFVLGPEAKTTFTFEGL
jgi:hypothetical protein